MEMHAQQLQMYTVISLLSTALRLLHTMLDSPRVEGWSPDDNQGGSTEGLGPMVSAIQVDDM